MIKDIYFATGNEIKLKDAQKRIGKDIILKQAKLDIVEPQSLDQEYVCTQKTREAFKILNEPVFCEDSGLYIEKYNSFPGVLTKFVLKGIGLEGIEKLIEEGEPAYYLDVIVYKDIEREIIVSTKQKGYLTKKNKSKKVLQNSLFDSLFIPDGFNLVVNDLSDEDYNRMCNENGIFDEFRKKILER